MAANDERSERAGEERRVRFLLSRLHLPAAKKMAMLRESERRTGRKRLTLDLFNEMVPNFPIFLGYRSREEMSKLHMNPAATLPSLFKRFQDAPFVRAYEAFYEEAEPRAQGRAVGLLFPRNGIVQGLIIHDGVGLDAYPVRSMMCVYPGGSREEPRRLVVQAFSPLVEAIGDRSNGWKADFAF